MPAPVQIWTYSKEVAHCRQRRFPRQTVRRAPCWLTHFSSRVRRPGPYAEGVTAISPHFGRPRPTPGTVEIKTRTLKGFQLTGNDQTVCKWSGKSTIAWMRKGRAARMTRKASRRQARAALVAEQRPTVLRDDGKEIRGAGNAPTSVGGHAVDSSMSRMMCFRSAANTSYGVGAAVLLDSPAVAPALNPDRFLVALDGERAERPLLSGESCTQSDASVCGRSRN